MCCQCFSKGSPHFFLSAAVAHLVHKGLHGSGREGRRPDPPALLWSASLVKHKCPFSGVTKEEDAVICNFLQMRVTRSCFCGAAHGNRSKKPLPSLAPPPIPQHKDAPAGFAPSQLILRTCGILPSFWERDTWFLGGWPYEWWCSPSSKQMFLKCGVKFSSPRQLWVRLHCRTEGRDAAEQWVPFQHICQRQQARASACSSHSHLQDGSLKSSFKIMGISYYLLAVSLPARQFSLVQLNMSPGCIVRVNWIFKASCR